MRSSATLVLISMLLAGSSAIAQKGGSEGPSPCNDWKAWHNLQPGTAPATLHVTGTCQFPTAGYSVELEPIKSAAHNIYVLRRVVHKPEGMAAQVITDVPVNYVIETSTDYKEVRIRHDRVRVKVEKVH